MLKGIETVVYFVEDVAKARDWYAKAFGVKPNYDTPYYVGFTIAGDELGLHPLGEGEEHPGVGGQTAYWSVDDVAAVQKHLVELGARATEEVREVGGGIKLTTITDPFGNAFGLIENPNSPNR
jgi:predicted enzyme related to lactoylglutathione lyase